MALKRKSRALREDKNGVVMILLVLLLVAVLFVAFLWISGIWERETVTEGIGGYKITVPMDAYISYSSYEQNNGLDQIEKIVVTWTLQSSEIIGQTLQRGEFANLVKDETTERLGTTNNWLGTEDYEDTLQNDADSNPEESKTWHTGDSSIEGNKGYQIVCNSKFVFTFKTTDGTTVFTKILTQPITVRVQPQNAGTWSTTRQYYMHCYIPKHVLPNGTHELDATVDYNVDGYWINQNWGNGAFRETTGALGSNWASLVQGGSWLGDFTKLGLIAVSTLAVTVAFGVLAGACWFVGITVLTGGSQTYNQQVSPKPVSGSGTLHFRVIIEPGEDAEETTDRETWTPGKYVREIIDLFTGGTNGAVIYGAW